MSEPLEDIERYLNNIDKAKGVDRDKMLDYRHWAYELLKISNEQAERVEKFEEQLNISARYIERKFEDNQRYKQALEEILKSKHANKEIQFIADMSLEGESNE